MTFSILMYGLMAGTFALLAGAALLDTVSTRRGSSVADVIRRRERQAPVCPQALAQRSLPTHGGPGSQSRRRRHSLPDSPQR
jgi:hypothetical protein